MREILWTLMGRKSKAFLFSISTQQKTLKLYCPHFSPCLCPSLLSFCLSHYKYIYVERDTFRLVYNRRKINKIPTQRIEEEGKKERIISTPTHHHHLIPQWDSSTRIDSLSSFLGLERKNLPKPRMHYAVLQISQFHSMPFRPCVLCYARRVMVTGIP